MLYTYYPIWWIDFKHECNQLAKTILKVLLFLQVLSSFRTLYWSSLEACPCSSWNARWDSLWACPGSGPGLSVPCFKVSNLNLFICLSFAIQWICILGFSSLFHGIVQSTNTGIVLSFLKLTRKGEK